jgi:hypothetical protein
VLDPGAGGAQPPAFGPSGVGRHGVLSLLTRRRYGRGHLAAVKRNDQF